MKIGVVWALSLAPWAGLSAQADAVEQVRERLPADVAEAVVGTLTEARNLGLPADPVVHVALEQVSKGRSGADVLTAVRVLLTRLENGRRVLEAGGRAPTGPETQAAALALSQGVDGATISALATAAPSGRALAVPLVVIGALAARGLPAADALSAVLARLESRATDAELATVPADVGSVLARGGRAEEVKRALEGGGRGSVGPAGVAAGPPSWVPTNGGRPGKRPESPGRQKGSGPGRP